MSKINKIFEIAKGVHLRLPSELHSFDSLALKGSQLPNPRRLFGNYILEASLVHFPSPRGTGKSWLAKQVCIAIAKEQNEFLGEKIEKHGNTLYVNYELGEGMLARRINKLYKVFTDQSSRFEAFALNTRIPLEEELEKIIKIIVKKQIVLVVIDNLRMATIGMDLNKGSDVTQLMFKLYATKDELKTSIIIIDHFRKHTANKLTDSDLQTGSGAKTDTVDADFFLRKSCQSKNYRILKRCKSRDAEEAEGAKLIELDPETMWFKLVEEDVNEAEHIGLNSLSDKEESKHMAIQLKQQGKTCRDIAEILGKSKSTISEWTKHIPE